MPNLKGGNRSARAADTMTKPFPNGNQGASSAAPKILYLRGTPTNTGAEVEVEGEAAGEANSPYTQSAIPSPKDTRTSTAITGAARWSPIPDEAAKIHSLQALQSLGMHYTREIIGCLNHISRVGEISPVQISSMLHSIRDLNNYVSLHPVSHVAMALHDAMVADNRWQEFSVPQYQKASKILEEASQSPEAKNAAIEKWLCQLWEAGFDIVPYECMPPADYAGEGALRNV